MQTDLEYPQEYLDKRSVINICLVGAGRIANIHLNNLMFNGRYRLIWVVDICIERAKCLANIAKCKYSNNLIGILDDDLLYEDNPYKIDCVLIASQTSTHYDLTMTCLKYNKHVFCEKPLGKTMEEIEDCFDFAAERRLKLMIGYQKRFDPDYVELCNKFKNNTPRNIKIISRDNPIPSVEFLKTSGGIVEDMISHDIDIINQIMNYKVPYKVMAFTDTHSDYFKEINEIEEIEIMMQYCGGEMVVFSGSRDAKSYGYDKRVEVFGDFGIYQLANKQDNIISKISRQGITASNIKYSFPDRFAEAYKNEIDYFYEMIVDNRPILVHKEHIKLTKQICMAINKSISTNQIVYFNDLKIKNADNIGGYQKNILRLYEENTLQYQTYLDMHKNQDYKFVTNIIEKHERRLSGNIKNANSEHNIYNLLYIDEVLLWMDDFVDPSDPDLELPNSVHAYQTAERIRYKYPNNEELQVCGLIHDLGKILFALGEPAWAVVGDTYVVGCKFPESIVFYDTMRENPDFNNPLYNTDLGVYEKNCGLQNVKISFGHDEYLYMILKHNRDLHTFPEKYWNIIRFHSLYPWHSDGEYRHLMNDTDYDILKDVLDFNEFDLYSKEDTTTVFTDEIKKYYLALLKKYFPNQMRW